MSTSEGKVVDLQAEGQNVGGDSRMVSRRTLIKAAWTVPVIAATVTPSSVFANGCSTHEGWVAPQCTESWGFYKRVENWTKDNLTESYSLEIYDGFSLSRNQIIEVLNDGVSQDVTFKLFRQLVATKIGTTYMQSPVSGGWNDIYTSVGSSTSGINGYIDWAEEALQANKYDGTNGFAITSSLSKADRSLWTAQSGMLDSYIAYYHCGE